MLLVTTHNVMIKEPKTKYDEERGEIKTMLDEKEDNVCFVYATDEEAKCAHRALGKWTRKNGYPVRYAIKRDKLYAIRTAEK